mmetsp:Transcript_6212/g.10098  ORF Transcript_6212/g.10098 Transcript_6212/m.10098 type:complete len:131 (+) Transcript_6212:683-1075(+)
MNTANEGDTLFIKALYDKGVIPQEMFSMCLTEGVSKSAMTVGGYNTAKYALSGQEIIWIGNDNTRSGYWQVTAASISAKFSKAKSFVNSARKIVIDSGTSLISLNSNDLDNFKEIIKDQTGKQAYLDNTG